MDIAQFGAHHITKVGSRPDLCSFLLQKASERLTLPFISQDFYMVIS